MIECVFTIDYEIYGNGEGSLQDLVLEPARKLKALFDEAEAKCVIFVEAAEFAKIDAERTEPKAIFEIREQIQAFYREGYEIALHLHPQWHNARYQNNKWNLDYSEYNLCTLPEMRIDEIVSQSIAYLREVLSAPDFSPLSFRAGNWLFQPTKTAARVLAKHGLKIDSSVFKGGRLHKHNLDYRKAIENGPYWRFETDAATEENRGALLEIPIYATMVPFWKMATGKRLHLQGKANAAAATSRLRLSRLIDLLRLKHPLKFDFCRMTLNELIEVIERARSADHKTPDLLKPIVAIGHTKDLVDFETVQSFLSFLRRNQIRISTFQDVYPRCSPPQSNGAIPV